MKLTEAALEVANPSQCTQPALGEKAYTFYDGELTPAETAKFEKHLASCEACKQKITNQDWIDSTLEETKARIAGGGM